MDPLVIGAIVLVAAVALTAVYVATQRRRSQQLRHHYGVEYDRAARELGQRGAEAELRSREKRVERLNLSPLGATQRDRFAARWRIVQTQFVDDPDGAVTQGDRLVEEVMIARGYPDASFEQRLADLSVHHPAVVQNYRAAREIAIRHQEGGATTEDLRRAMVYYRELFDDLLEEHTTADRDVGLRVEREASAERVAERRDRHPLDREVKP
jgi:hypothetical protein